MTDTQPGSGSGAAPPSAQQLPEPARHYLARLEDALRDVPYGVAREIHAGVAEELSGLDAAGASVRIDQLGDPTVIAAEAAAATVGERAAASAPAQHPATPPLAIPLSAPRPAPASRGFAIAAALLVGLGGFVVPAVGWVAGIAMMWMSPLWRRSEKWIATLLPAAVFAVAGGIALLTQAAHEADAENVPMRGDFAAPHFPVGFDSLTSAMLLVFFSSVPAGAWLLWRLKGRQ